MAALNTARLRRFIGDFAALSDAEAGVRAREGASLLGSLVAHDDWLPDAYAQADPARYRQYLLHCDSRERFCVVSFVWGPDQATPIHNHTVWGLVGVLRGVELAQRYTFEHGRLTAVGAEERLAVGAVDAVSPESGDIHRVRNGLKDAVSISIHVYGANIGAVRRAVFTESGDTKPFISGYSNATLPNLWDQSSEPAAALA